MKALILNGERSFEYSLSKFSKIIEDLLKGAGYQIKTIILHEKNIGNCIGCFGCWLKKPGICIIEDDAQEVAREVINSDIIIYLTPVTFGGYSSQLKKALDRNISLISPFFGTYHGEVHHRPRYKKYPSLIGIGVFSEYNKDQAELFTNLVERNAYNFHSPSHASQVFTAGESLQEIELKINSLLSKVGVNYE